MLDTLRSYILKYGGAMTAFSMLIPAAYVHESNASQEDGTANYMLRSTLLMSLANAVKDLADSVNCLNELLGVGGRVISLSNLLHDTSNRSTTTTTTTVKRINNKNDIIINNLDVSVPSTTLKTLTLIKNLTATIKDGQHTVVIGPNGTGKTSLFRTLGGVWKPTNGHAIVPSNLYVMPQRPYFTWRGTLWEQVAYPNEREILAKSIKGRQMIEYWLNIVGLENIVQKRGINASDDDFHSKIIVF
jgi:ATP-binding cassette subfamily D (ALD) long-chain fatty acid import protein